MDNGIVSRQNLPDNIKKLAAQRYFYSRAKRLTAVQTVLDVLSPIVGAITVVLKPDADLWAATVGIAIALLDTLLLEPKQTGFRELGANTQEEFDCSVLDLPWNAPLAGDRVNAEDIHEGYKTYKPSKSAPLEDWYPKVVAALPLYQARLVCQRTNSWWDSKLRRRYCGWIGGTLSVVIASVIMLGLVNGMSLQKFVLAVVAPLLPAILWASREYQRQKDTAARSDRLKAYGESLWEQVIRNEIAESEVSKRCRELQDAILIRRQESAPVFDWVYKLLRSKQEGQMNVGAQKMVDEINRGKESVI
jgi:predicted pore-forming effector associated with SMODS systems